MSLSYLQNEGEIDVRNCDIVGQWGKNVAKAVAAADIVVTLSIFTIFNVKKSILYRFTKNVNFNFNKALGLLKCFLYTHAHTRSLFLPFFVFAL